MFIDLHVHEMRYSTDSFLALEEIVELAKKRNLNGICITDHDSMGLREFAEEYSIKTGFPIFVGIEYYSLDGDILAFGIDSYPKERIGAQEFIDLVHEQGGVVVSAHPFRHNRRGLEEEIDILKGLDAIEILNGSTLPDATMKAVLYAKKWNLAATGGSDCHIPEKVGVYATYFPNEVRTVEELVQAIKNHECKPAYLQDNKYFVWDLDNLIYE
ncbi:MAG: PHP domain-containing protein [Schaedlerella sp.]|nr:PHP domain-containing protein [Schaedlerella sp.]